MCGIAGYIRPAGLLDSSVLSAMRRSIRHRGPDGEGEWIAPGDGLALAHTRLKVQDLSEAADQPMHSADGAVTLVFNGEIYNFRELRDELRRSGAAFRSTGDTEVLLELCRRDPSLSFLSRLNGMFAFALWHAPTKTLSLVRDRTGVKPLLYAPREGGVVFASEMAALRPVIGTPPIDARSVVELLTLGFIAAPRTIFRGVRKLPPGHLLRWGGGASEVRRWTLGPHRLLAGATPHEAGATPHEAGATPHEASATPHEASATPHEASATLYEAGATASSAGHPFSATNAANGGPNVLPVTGRAGDFDEACRAIREAFDDAVRLRLIADVPVGVFLSGGIDSAIVTAVASRVSGAAVRTFSVAFPDEPFYDESAYARAVADMHGTQHTMLPLSLAEIRDIIPTVQAHLGEPFADSSALPTYLLSRLTRRHVTVALSGDGADELFAGYNRYAAATLNERFGWLAATPLYGLARRIIERLPARRETRLGGIASQLKRAIRSMDRRLPHRHANWMRTSDDRTLAMLLHEPERCPALVEAIALMLWEHRGQIDPGPECRRRDSRQPSPDDNDLNLHLRTEWRLSLPDDMLTKIDLMSMAHGLEVRSPFLDYRLVDLVFPMPWKWKLAGWRRKHLLIEAFKDMLPPALHDRPKKGFEVPVGVWLRGPLRKMALDLIEADRCFFGTILSRSGARRLLEEHARGRADHNFCLWALVSLLAWQQQHAPGAVVDLAALDA